MKINSRLKLIGDLIAQDSYPLDIGCDHALLSIYLIKERKLKQALASDNKPLPLKKALENVKYYHVEDKVRLIEANGLDSYNDKVDTVTISGIGGLNINSILDHHKDYFKTINTFIISPNNYQLSVKQKLTKYGYFIADEYLIKDKNIIYQIIIFKKGKKHYSYKDLFLGPVLKIKKDPLIKEYYQKELTTKENLLKVLPKKYLHKRLITKKEIIYLKEMLNKK